MTAEYIVSTNAPHHIIIQGEGTLAPFVDYMGGEIIDTLDGELCEIPFTQENALSLRLFLKGKDYEIPLKERKILETLADSPEKLKKPTTRWTAKLTDLRTNKLEKSYSKIKTEWDLIHYLPLRYLDKSNPQKVADLTLGEWAVIAGTVYKVEPNYIHKYVKIVVSDITGQRISATFFLQPWLAKVFKEGDEVVVYGNYSEYVNKNTGGRFPQITNPKIDKIRSLQTAQTEGLGMVPIYPQKSENRTWQIKTAQEALLDKIIWIEDPVPEIILKKYNLISRTDAYKKIHFPNNVVDVENARRRIAFDEFIRLQVFIRSQRALHKTSPSSRKEKTQWANKFTNALGFDFTGAQERVIQEIITDLKENTPMHRLLQGDVGSGKAQPLHSKVLTPSGFKTMGEIETGDAVITPNGTTEYVLAVYPQGNRPVYEITLENNVKVEADINHLWVIKNNGVKTTVTTQWLIENASQGVQYFSSVSLPIAKNLTFFGKNWDKVHTPYDEGYEKIKTITPELIRDWLNYSLENRKEIIAGAIEGQTNMPRLVFENHATSMEFTTLLHSIGYSNDVEYDIENGLWTISKEQIATHLNDMEQDVPEITYEKLKSIKFVRHEETKCILISGEDHLYVTDNFIVTHNTEISSVATLVAAESGYQVALLAPTDILATQLHERLQKTFRNAGIPESELKVGLFTGKVIGKKRAEFLEALKKNEIQVVVGTHALSNPAIEFANLGLAIIDEQHKFGTVTRNDLRKTNEDGSVPDMLMMSATPIPRTTAQIIFGDLDISIVDELPAGRIPIETEWHETPENAWDKIREEVNKGHQAYVVAALVEESEKMENVEDAVSMHNELQYSIFPEFKVGLLHGKLKNTEKNEVLQKYANKEYDILVATSVVEVGINVPNATVMTILNANRFGIASLHQIRGRVGRGKLASYCYLVGKATVPEAEERLNALVSSNDGFWLADKDLEIRGEGSLFGTLQSGSSDLYVGNLREHKDLLEVTKKVAKQAANSILLKQEVEMLYKDKIISA